MIACSFPGCTTPAAAYNRATQPMCHAHRPVVIGSSDDPGKHGKHCDETSDQ